ncbi:MAG TPA: GNAT family N-acetyltransferase [Syntrophales bacterium]|nr:GNAT family N-acetyltransferase [Syntrophales bacterium]HOX94700.1 GNAT family N-acetyltransferase [Syntrophales bacterium]HPI55824.1 GNAT family N-acetyltransferase [Syntrophales bacterium]HPN23685.1 GNAT family N-acetyltransferase [Syntrophales bacterium]HQM27790.1 GNAT family N-acetyltransferase [Syntrophales bacterium]
MKTLDDWKKTYPEKFVPEEEIFRHVHRGDTIFIGSACAEPQYLVHAMIRYVKSHPKAFFDAEVLHVRSLGVAPYASEMFKQNFRYNSFFIGNSTREAVNRGVADYTPVFLSKVPELFRRGLARVDLALIQVSPPDDHGYLSLGISVDIVKAATEAASVVVAQVNAFMPRVLGDAFIHIDDVDYLVPYDEPLLEYSPGADTDIAQRIGKYVARLVEDGDTIQVGYGSIPDAVLSNLAGKKHLGVHTELLSDGIVELMRVGVIDNSRKSIDRGKTVATFCMGRKETYDYIHDNPAIEFQTIDYTNNPLTIARHENMVAINTALEIDLTGQATAESIGKSFYSGVGGQADFMRGAVLSKRGKTILTLQSTAAEEVVSRIVPFLKEGAGATLIRGDIQYVVTEYGIAYLQGKNIRERAMELIAIAHPKFRLWLIEEAKKAGLIYRDQAFIPGERGQYPEDLETYRTTKKGLNLFFRPIKISDEPLLKDFVYSLSDQSLYRRFLSRRQYMPHEYLQELVVIDYTREMAMFAFVEKEDREELVGVGRYFSDPDTHMAEVAFAVRDDYQGQGIGAELLSLLTYLARRQGLLGFTAEVLDENATMLHVFEKGGFETEKRTVAGVCELKMKFRNR